MRLFVIVAVLILAGKEAAAQMQFPGFYGPLTARMKAGEQAPRITGSQVRSSTDVSWNNSLLSSSGKLTVLGFFPNISSNPQIVTMWNQQWARLHAKVQFVWITGEDMDTLQPFLQAHPVEGWVLWDQAGTTGVAYGLELPMNVLVDRDGTIIGFFDGPQIEPLVSAVEDHRITTVHPTSATIREFVAKKLTLIDAEPRKMPRPTDHRPAIEPSYSVRIAASWSEERGNFSADDYISLKAYTLTEALSWLYDIENILVVMPEGTESGVQYDFDLLLPAPESSEAKRSRMREAALEFFHLQARRERRIADAYVVTLEPGRRPPMPSSRLSRIGAVSSTFGGTISSVDTLVGLDDPKHQLQHSLTEIRSMSFEGTAGDLCKTLQDISNTPCVDATGLQGQFEFQIKETNSGEAFLQELRKQTGLSISSLRREVEMIVVQPI